MPSIIAIPAFADNYIWAIRDGDAVAVVDPGDAAPVARYLAREQLTLCAIITTHHHADHVGGVRALLEQWSVPVFGPARETIPGRTQALREGDDITVPTLNLPFTVLDVPGHTAGHIAYVSRGGMTPTVFCGDTLFACGCGKLFEGTAEEMAQSLSKLAHLPPETLVYCAHEYTLSNLRFALKVEPGNPKLHERQAREQRKRDQGEPTVPSTIAIERETNPFLRVDVPAVVDAAERHAGLRLRGRTAVFAALRTWKNNG